jgi:hypothetical protein
VTCIRGPQGYGEQMAVSARGAIRATSAAMQRCGFLVRRSWGEFSTWRWLGSGISESFSPIGDVFSGLCLPVAGPAAPTRNVGSRVRDPQRWPACFCGRPANDAAAGPPVATSRDGHRPRGDWPAATRDGEIPALGRAIQRYRAIDNYCTRVRALVNRQSEEILRGMGRAGRRGREAADKETGRRGD